MSAGLTLRGYARRRRVSHTAVQKALASGRITLGADGRIDPDVADRQWADLSKPQNSVTGDPGSRSRPSAGPEGGAQAVPGERVAASYRESLAAREAYRARLAKLDFEERTGKLVSADEVRAVTFRVARATRDQIMGVPARLAPLVAAATEPLEVQRLLEEALRDVCAELSHAVKAMATAGSPDSRP